MYRLCSIWEIFMHKPFQFLIALVLMGFKGNIR
jgi:hypothetical protein